MTDCTAPRHDGQAEPTPAEAHASLCAPCRRGLASDLRRLPSLFAGLLAAPGGYGGDGTGLPFSEPARDCCDQIRHDLSWWAREVTRIRGQDAPPVLEDGWAVRPVAVMCTWLHSQVTWCSFRPWAPDMAGAIGADRVRAVTLLDPWIKHHFPIMGPDGICLHCPARLEVTIFGEGDRRRPFIMCPGCGERWDPEQWDRFGRQVIRRRSLQETG